uniref:Fucolectin tachylectin-4 pentraxin-1 domain-containing protein n=1 Tax=Cyprinus carpio TaxID=7962 RepID=A0A8C1LEJ7_CYPCA
MGLRAKIKLTPLWLSFPSIFLGFICNLDDFSSRFLGNLASNGSTTQSSTSGDWFAERAIDGNRGLHEQYKGGCSSTLAETNPWWRLDLNNVYSVSRVVVTNRIDCCVEKINGAEIRIGNSLENNGNNNPICAVIPAIPAGESYSFSCGGMEGRYVNLIIPGDMKTLTLCEVEVFGEEPRLPTSEGYSAGWGTANQSTTYENLHAQYALDGNNYSCTHTDEQSDPWWTLDLMTTYSVNRVTITNRRDCCESRIDRAEIRVGNDSDVSSNPICAVVSSIAAGATYSYSCRGMKGRYVTVNIPGALKILTLCEVGVYGVVLHYHVQILTKVCYRLFIKTLKNHIKLWKMYIR